MVIGRDFKGRRPITSKVSLNLFTASREGEGPDTIKKELWSFPAFLSREEGDPRVHTDDKFLTQTEEDKRHVKYTRHFVDHKSRNYAYFIFPQSNFSTFVARIKVLIAMVKESAQEHVLVSYGRFCQKVHWF